MPGYGNWRTPDEVFKLLDDEFHFTLDACASHANAKTRRYCTDKGTFYREADLDGAIRGAMQDDAIIKLSDRHGLMPEAWEGCNVFCNPPYTDATLKQAIACAKIGYAKTSVLILPPNFDTAWARSMIPGDMHAFVRHYDKWISFSFDTCGEEGAMSELRLWNGRIKFGVPKRRSPEQALLGEYDETDPETVIGPAPRAGSMIAIWR